LCILAKGGRQNARAKIRYTVITLDNITSSRESVGHNVVNSLLALEVKAVFLKQLHPAGLLTSELGLRGEITEGGVVGVESEFSAIEVVAPGAKGMDNS